MTAQAGSITPSADAVRRELRPPATLNMSFQGTAQAFQDSLKGQGLLLVATVHLGAVARVEAGPGAVAFGASVVLTMLAAMSFDPRLIWDAHDRQR